VSLPPGEWREVVLPPLAVHAMVVAELKTL
jgi:hypothetical protein